MKWRLIGLITILGIFPLSAQAQSDCAAPYCGTEVLVGVELDWNVATATYFQFSTGHEFYLRVRTAPEPGYIRYDNRTYLFNGSGTYATDNIVNFLFPIATEWKGTVIIDWASYHEEVGIETYHYAVNDTLDWSHGDRLGIVNSFLEPGCYEVPVPFGTDINFAFYNNSETHYQTVAVDGEIYLVPPTPINGGSTRMVARPSQTLTAKVCVGVVPTVPPAGVDFQLPLYFSPRFSDGDILVFSTLWGETLLDKVP